MGTWTLPVGEIKVLKSSAFIRTSTPRSGSSEAFLVCGLEDYRPIVPFFKVPLFGFQFPYGAMSLSNVAPRSLAWP